MRFVSTFSLAAGLALAALATPANATLVLNQPASDGLAALKALNVIALCTKPTDTTCLVQGGHDIEGKAWVGGNLSAANSFNVGTGNTKQGAATSGYATLTVAGNLAAQNGVNLNDGKNGGSGTVGTGHYGMTVAGDSGAFTPNAKGATVKIGGTITNQNFALSTNGALDLSIHGWIKSVTAGAGSSIKLGSVGGSIGTGANSTVQIASGGASSVTMGNNSSLQAGGNVAALTTGNNSTSTITGTLGSQSFNAGSGSVTKAAAYGSQNVNALNGNAKAYINGSNPSQNGTPAGWTFNAGQTLTAPSAPASFSLASDKTTMVTDMLALSSQLSSLSSLDSAGKVNVSGGVYDELFTVSDTSQGYAAFTISSADLFGARNIGFALDNVTVPIIINVTGAGGTFGAGALSYNGSIWSSALNQQIIWNFADATSITVNNLFHGSILAPNATVTNSTPIEGSVVAELFNQNGEVHLGTYDGSDVMVYNNAAPPAAVPEPASWITMVLGFGVIGGAIRARRRAARPLAAA